MSVGKDGTMKHNKILWPKDILLILALPVISIILSMLLLSLISHTEARSLASIERIYSLVVRFEDMDKTEQVVRELKTYADMLQETYPPNADSIEEWRRWYLTKRIEWKDKHTLWFEKPRELQMLLNYLLNKGISVPETVINATLSDIRRGDE